MTEQEFRNYLAAGIVCSTLWPGVEEDSAQWETLYNGVVTVDAISEEQTNAGLYPHTRLLDDTGELLFVEGHIIRISVGGVSSQYTAVKSDEAWVEGYYAGNECLTELTPEEPDNGYDFAVSVGTSLVGVHSLDLYSRNPGTYSVKIERKKPVAYSYNGYIFPQLPDWDKEAYPHVYIGSYALFEWSARATPFKFQVKKTDSGSYACYPPDDVETPAPGLHTHTMQGGKYPWWGHTDNENPNMWKKTTYGRNAITEPIWSNYNIYTDDGTLYLAASTPIPVYE